ncbi:hypothetical protein [Desulfopila sp. IMCC35008]|uniref:tetratricopeptide repeat protein n=1 Tax=Desulfopila sp. IMCC35008 TaxID=2653858 RepID=UPI0013D03F7E|nr:hypothetical protein [Desulfopila sp. IMCC35008]
MPYDNEFNELFAAESEVPLPHDHIRQQFHKIIASPEFLATRKQRDFLTFVVAETLAGRSNTLKGYTVATQVFDRAEDFNGSVDPIVSIQANKLRRALERYYLIDGRLDPIRIDIPKGSYVPTFSWQDEAEIEKKHTCSVSESAPDRSWPAILIVPFKNLTGDPEYDFYGSGISSEMANEVSCFENVRVHFPRDGIMNAGVYARPRFVLTGELFKDRNGLTLAVHLADTKLEVQIWGETCETEAGLQELYSFKKHVVKTVATKICGEFGVIPKAITKEVKSKLPSELTTYEAVLKFWEYEQSMTPKAFEQAFVSLTRAVSLESDNCLALGSLAILYCTIYNLDIPGFENPLDKAVEYAEKAALINPNNQRVLATLALARLTSNELTAAICEAHNALELNPDSLFVMNGLAWILTLSGDWEHGPRLAKKAIRLNPFHRAITHDALWVNYLRLEKYDLAYKESTQHHRRTLFWDPLISASTLGLMGRSENGKKFIEKLLRLRPDFRVKGKMLIGNYIKSDVIADKVFEGLARSGLIVK